MTVHRAVFNFSDTLLFNILQAMVRINPCLCSCGGVQTNKHCGVISQRIFLDVCTDSRPSCYVEVSSFCQGDKPIFLSLGQTSLVLFWKTFQLQGGGPCTSLNMLKYQEAHPRRLFKKKTILEVEIYNTPFVGLRRLWVWQSRSLAVPRCAIWIEGCKLVQAREHGQALSRRGRVARWNWWTVDQ